MHSAIFAAGLALLPVASLAQTVNAEDPDRLVYLLQNEGYLATVGTDDVGDPKISGKISGTNYNIFFYDCTNNAKCLTIQFQAAYDMSNGMSLARANQWNSEKRYASVFLDDEMDPFLQMDMNIDFGVSEKNFVDNFTLWTQMIESFEEFIDW